MTTDPRLLALAGADSEYCMTSSNLEFPLNPSLNGVSAVISRKVDEALIERFVRFPETLDGTTLEAVGASVETYKKEQAIEKFYRQFYEEFDKLEDKVSSNVARFVSSLFE